MSEEKLNFNSVAIEAGSIGLSVKNYTVVLPTEVVPEPVDSVKLDKILNAIILDFEVTKVNDQFKICLMIKEFKSVAPIRKDFDSFIFLSCEVKMGSVVMFYDSFRLHQNGTYSKTLPYTKKSPSIPVNNGIIEFKFEILPVYPIAKYPRQFNLLPLLALAFSQIVPQIRYYDLDWPLLNWIRQYQCCDDRPSIQDLLDIVDINGDFDLNMIAEGYKDTKEIDFEHILPIENEKKLDYVDYVYNQLNTIDDSSIIGKGMTSFQIQKLVLLFVTKFTQETNLTYSHYSTQPVHNQKSKISNHLIIFTPIFYYKTGILPEILSNKVLYILYAAVREEQGLYTATYFLPYNQKYYDIRGDHVSQIKQGIPHVYNPQERYIAFIYVREDLHDTLKTIQPILPFYTRFPYVDVHRWNSQTKTFDIELNQSSESLEAKIYNNKCLIFPYDEQNQYPSAPITTIVGKRVLMFDILESNVSKPCQLIWIQNINNDGILELLPQMLYINPDLSIGFQFVDMDNVRFVKVSDHCITRIYNTKDIYCLPFPVESLMCMKILALQSSVDNKNERIVSISFGSFQKSLGNNGKVIKYLGNPILVQVDSKSSVSFIKLKEFVQAHVQKNFENEAASDYIFIHSKEKIFQYKTKNSGKFNEILEANLDESLPIRIVVQLLHKNK